MDGSKSVVFRRNHENCDFSHILWISHNSENRGFSRGFLKPRNSIKIGFFHSLGASRRPGRVRLNIDF